MDRIQRAQQRCRKRKRRTRTRSHSTVGFDSISVELETTSRFSDRYQRTSPDDRKGCQFQGAAVHSSCPTWSRLDTQASERRRDSPSDSLLLWLEFQRTRNSARLCSFRLSGLSRWKRSALDALRSSGLAHGCGHGEGHAFTCTRCQ